MKKAPKTPNQKIQPTAKNVATDFDVSPLIMNLVFEEKR